MLTDWIMIFITLVYVVATIFICVYNGKSANESKKQTEEMKKQFYSINRPILTTEIICLKKSFFALRITNNGNQTAFNTVIEIHQNFIDGLTEGTFKELLEKDKGKLRNIGVGQHYDLFFGSNEYLRQKEKVPLSGRLIYDGYNNSIYAENFMIEVEKYASFFSVDTDIDDIRNEIKKQTEAIKQISKTIENSNFMQIK